MFNAWRAWCDESRPPSDPPERARGWWRVDVAAAVVVVVVTVLEVTLRNDLVWRPVAVGVGVAMAALLPFRQRQPLWTLVGALAVGHVVAIAATLLGVPWRDLGIEVIVLAFVYSLYRHGSGREGVVGLIVLAIVWAVAAQGIINPSGTASVGADAAASGVVLVLPIMLGYAVRNQVLAQRRAVDAARDEVKSAERLRLARELHDTVAHHVSAILIQARVGKAVVADAAAVGAVLHDIEGAAQASLNELRDVVGALRSGETADSDDDIVDAGAPLGPTASLANLEVLLASEPHPKLRVTLHKALGTAPLRSAVDVAAARLIREALTNARRHARPQGDRDLVSVSISLRLLEETLELVVDDDGAAVAGHRRGHGLVGMEERVRLLGGTIAIGPRDSGGWRVNVRLPNAVLEAGAAS